MGGPDCAFGYAQARLQARLGARIGTADWQRLHGTRELGALLQLAGATPLAPCTRDLGAHLPVHVLESRLRQHWLASVDEVAAWQPPPWRGAVRWLRWLPYLPALEKLARGGAPPEWMRADAVLGPLVAEDPRLRAERLQREEFAPLAAGFAARPDVSAAWSRHWRRTWPAAGGQAPALERLLHQVAAVRRELQSAAPGARSAAPIARLEKRLLANLRRHPLTPLAAVAWLGLVGLDLLQLRGCVAVRAVQGAGGEA